MKESYLLFCMVTAPLLALFVIGYVLGGALWGVPIGWLLGFVGGGFGLVGGFISMLAITDGKRRGK